MKLKELIATLSQYPEDTEVAIFDWKRVDKEATDEATSAGIYPEFEVYMEDPFELDDKQYPTLLCLSFENTFIDVEEEELGHATDRRISISLSGPIMTFAQAKDLVAQEHGFSVVMNSPGWTRWMQMMDGIDVYGSQKYIDRAMEIYADAKTSELNPDRKYLKHDPFEQLQQLQLEFGYEKGELNVIALFGLFGEAGEVLNEIYFPSDKYREGLKAMAASVAWRIDEEKKKLRQLPLDKLPEVLFENGRTGEQFDIELADQLYYLNLCALGRGRTLQYYAELSYQKVKAKGLKQPTR